MEKFAEVPRSGVVAGCQGNLLGSHLLGSWWYLGDKRLRGQLQNSGGRATGCSAQRILPTENQSRESACWQGSHVQTGKSTRTRRSRAPSTSVLAMCPLALWWECPPRVHVWKPDSHYSTVKRWDFGEMFGSALMSGLMLFSRERGRGNKDAFGPLLSCTCSVALPPSATVCD